MKFRITTFKANATMLNTNNTREKIIIAIEIIIPAEISGWKIIKEIDFK